MKRSQRWNTLQICPRRDSNLGGSNLWSNALSIRPRRRPHVTVGGVCVCYCHQNHGITMEKGIQIFCAVIGCWIGAVLTSHKPEAITWFEREMFIRRHGKQIVNFVTVMTLQCKHIGKHWRRKSNSYQSKYSWLSDGATAHTWQAAMMDCRCQLYDVGIKSVNINHENTASFVPQET